jgi:hypothetical protein
MTAPIVYDRSRRIVPKHVRDIDVIFYVPGDALVDARRAVRGQLWERIAEGHS